jgi:hypothetical protein
MTQPGHARLKIVAAQLDASRMVPFARLDEKTVRFWPTGLFPDVLDFWGVAGAPRVTSPAMLCYGGNKP